jgi:transposase InsO family protein
MPSNTDPIFALEAWLAKEDPHISIDWNTPMALNTETGTYKLFTDTGTNVYISPCREDFTTFTPIAPRAIKGFQGSSINALGIGTIVTDKLTQELALYVPDVSVRLLSVLRVCQANNYTFHFDNKSAWITDASTTVVCSGSVHPSRNLYRLHTRPISLAPNVLSVVPSYANTASISARDLRHWHLCLGHAHHQAVADLFTNDHADGMDLDPSIPAPACDTCVLGKQARTNVPRVREGRPTTRILERVHIDLSGRIATKLRSGNEYTFDIVDAHSTRSWVFPIPNKASCFETLCAWQLETERHTGERVGTYIIDNGELKSDEFVKWCREHGITVIWTPPHVSKVNGKVE